MYVLDWKGGKIHVCIPISDLDSRVMMLAKLLSISGWSSVSLPVTHAELLLIFQDGQRDENVESGPAPKDL